MGKPCAMRQSIMKAPCSEVSSPALCTNKMVSATWKTQLTTVFPQTFPSLACLGCVQQGVEVAGVAIGDSEPLLHGKVHQGGRGCGRDGVVQVT